MEQTLVLEGETGGPCPPIKEGGLRSPCHRVANGLREITKVPSGQLGQE
jgi:hypothetical protein